MDRSRSPLRRVWSRFLSPIDALPLDIFRVCVGFVLLAYFVRTLLEVADISSPDGLLDHDLILRMYWFTEIGLFRSWMSSSWYYAAISLAILCCIPLIVGYRVKFFSLILYVIAVSTYRRNFIVMYVDDAIMHLLLFWMLVLPVGRTLVVSEWLKYRETAWERWKSVTVPGSTLQLFFCNLALLYLVAGLWKWTSPMWLDGTALYVVFKLPISYFHDFWSAEHIPLLKVFNYATLVLEPLVPLMFVLKRGSVIKYLLLIAFIGLHVGSVATLNIPFANIACTATAILIMREEIMAWLHKGRNASVNERAKMNVTQVGTLLNSRVSASVVVAGVMVGLLTLAMISSVTMLNWRTAPRVAETTIRDQGEHAKLVDGRADGLDSVQMTFFGALWLMGIAQQYQLFNWIDHRNYATHYRVIVDGNEVDADKMFVRSLRGVLLDFYIHDITWLRVPPEHREELRRSILERTAARYCRNEHPTGEVEAHSSFETIDPNGGVGAFDNAMLMRFRCQGEQPIF